MYINIHILYKKLLIWQVALKKILRTRPLIILLFITYLHNYILCTVPDGYYH